MPYILRYNTTMNGEIAFTENTLGLNQVAENNQGNTGSIGAFSALNTALRAGNFPLGTTLDYTLNGSTAVLDLPSGAALYAELIWVGSYDDGGGSVLDEVSNPPQSGTVVVNPKGTFTYTPNPDFTGTDNFTIIATNSVGESTSISFTVGVTVSGPVNVPITADIGLGTNQDQPVSGIIIASDLEGFSLTFQSSALPNSGSVVLNPDGSFIYTPNSGFVGTDTFRVRVTNSLGGSALSIVSVVVYPSVDPSSVKVELTTRAGTSVSDSLSAGQGVYVLPSGPSHGSVQLNPDGTFVYTPEAGFTGVDEFMIQFTDRTRNVIRNIIHFNISVNVVPQSNTLTLGLRTEENHPLSSNLNTIGIGLVITAQIVDTPNNGRLVLNANGTYTYFPGPDYTGPDQFAFIVTDAQGSIYIVIVRMLIYPELEE
ncbi:Ig-like domain-containing protein [Paenibacillus sp. Marseille-Q4541]|uniref:Ig-like domain-containing protein n=1 Tax=Paenibacillus sp. Marseille-Q4541 TaxID=2831522 RepID=UPI001BAE327D|nr:Ig-like domain-containing protein [Paenibacillus sp. Marseille-Q4541]